VTPFWQNLYQAGVLPFPGFAFYLTRFINVTSAAQVEPGGSLTFGYLNSSLYQGEINYVDIPDGMESYWVIPMTAIAVNGTNATLSAEAMVAIDTGTTLIGGPQEVVSEVYAMIDGALAATGDYAGEMALNLVSCVTPSKLTRSRSHRLLFLPMCDGSQHQLDVWRNRACTRLSFPPARRRLLIVLVFVDARRCIT
jgi:hypothetical protein